MRTVAILSGKGGAGKTTLCLHLAVAAERRGLSAAILDTDPQASAAQWGDSREAEAPAVMSIQPSRLAKTLDAARQEGADLALIDTAPHSADAAMSAAEAADMILIPCRPGILDLRAIGATARIAKIAGKPAHVVLNATPPHAPRLIEDAREAVAAHALPVAPVIIAQRAAFAHALTAGLSAEEYEAGGKAAEEIAALFDWLKTELAF